VEVGQHEGADTAVSGGFPSAAESSGGRRGWQRGPAARGGNEDGEGPLG
jgi:hypothetical protein